MTSTIGTFPGADSGLRARVVADSVSLALVAISAVVFTLSYPPWGFRALAWICMVPLFLAWRINPLGRAIVLAVAWTFAMSYGITDWLIDGVATYYQQGTGVGIAVWVAATALGGCPEYSLVAAAYVLAARYSVVQLPLVAGAAWAFAELLRTRIGTGNPWGMFGYSQSGLADAASGAAHGAALGDTAALAVTQVADLGGVYAVSFVLIVANAAIAEILLAAAGRVDPRLARRATAVATAVVAAAFVYGSARVGEVANAEPPFGAESTRVAIVQGDLDLGSQWKPEHYGQNLDAYLRLTAEAAVADAPALVIWPENALTFFLDREPKYRAHIARVLAPLRAQLIAGAPRFDGEGDDAIYYNSAFVLQVDGVVAGTYDKQRLLPFAEYFPLGSIDLLRRRFGRVREFASGPMREPVETAAGRAGVLICNEAMYPRDARARVRAGAQYLLNLSNDTWLGDAEFSEHVFAMAALRAVEHRRYLVRASTSGPSAIVAPDGRAVVRSGLFVSTAIAGGVVAADGATVYTRFGDAFAWACGGLVFLSLAVARRRP